MPMYVCIYVFLCFDSLDKMITLFYLIIQSIALLIKLSDYYLNSTGICSYRSGASSEKQMLISLITFKKTSVLKVFEQNFDNSSFIYCNII